MSIAWRRGSSCALGGPFLHEITLVKQSTSYLSIAAEENHSNQALIDWGRDVLTKFFSVVGEDATIDPLRERFECHHSTSSTDTLQLVPYQRDQTPLAIDYDGLAELAWRRRSVRWYLDKPVPRDTIDRAVEVAKLSPSACNRQPFEFRVFDAPETVRKVSEIPLGTDRIPRTIFLVSSFWSATSAPISASEIDM